MLQTVLSDKREFELITILSIPIFGGNCTEINAFLGNESKINIKMSSQRSQYKFFVHMRQ